MLESPARIAFEAPSRILVGNWTQGVVRLPFVGRAWHTRLAICYEGLSEFFPGDITVLRQRDEEPWLAILRAAPFRPSGETGPRSEAMAYLSRRGLLKAHPSEDLGRHWLVGIGKNREEAAFAAAPAAFASHCIMVHRRDPDRVLTDARMAAALELAFGDDPIRRQELEAVLSREICDRLVVLDDRGLLGSPAAVEELRDLADRIRDIRREPLAEPDIPDHLPVHED